ncbi:MAG TPA: hypothetical protein VMY37_00630 [Thermoguttaceae bacterium]|nr:hypothetical protein [Thermoguttaceae bacterium]
MRFVSPDVDARKVISVTLRERPPIRIDKLVFFDADGEPCLAVEAEEATPPTEDDVARFPAQRFWIKSPDAARATVKRSTPKGIVVPVCKLCERTSRRLGAGEVAEVANLLYTDETTERLDLEIQRIASGAVLVRGKEDALCAVRGARIDGLAFDADMLYLSPSRVAWANGRSLQCGKARIAGEGMSGLEIDLSTSETVARTPDGQPARVETSGVSSDLVRGLLDSLASGAAKIPAREETPLPVARAAWTTRLEDGEPVRRLKLGDLDGDDVPEILAVAGNGAFALDADGRVRWSHPLGAACYDLEAGELTAEAGLEVALAGGDTYAHLLDRNGKPLSKHQIRGPAWNQNFGDRPWQAYTVAVRDLDRDDRRRHPELRAARL